MRSLTIAIVLSSICAGVLAQKPADAAGKPSAAANAAATEKWQQINEIHQARIKDLARDDKDGHAKALDDRVADLGDFLQEHGKAAEANGARLQLAQAALRNAKHKDAAATALAGYDASQNELGMAVAAATVAGRLELTDRRDALLDQVEQRAKTIAERIELITAVKLSLRDEARAAKLVAATEAMAKTDEDKAALGLGKARLFRYENRDDQAGYAAAMKAVADQFPKTKSGTIAASKIAAAKIAPGSEPVAFTAKDMDGKDVSPADYKGKVLLIDFWATWCGPCMAELPHVLDVYKEHHAAGFEILGISLDRAADKEKLVATIRDRGMSWRHVFDGKHWEAEIAQLHDVNSIPYTILIGRDGRVFATNLSGDALAAKVKEALAR
jgi:thiol-disulfide isomerase/thioredoxin